MVRSTGWSLVFMGVITVLVLAEKVSFVPPTEAECQKALGSTKDLPPGIRRALEPATHFSPVPKPGPADWLANHREPGQTFDEFVASRPNLPDSARRTIYLQPLGPLEADRCPPLEDLAEICTAEFGLPVKVLGEIDLAGERLTTRLNAGTKKPQYLTDDLRALLKRRLPKDAYCLLGLIQADLYPDPKWNYVFGEASLQDRVGVYSVARFDPEFFGEKRPDDYRTLLLERSAGTLVHETAHMFGMQHCIYYHCVLNGSNNQVESDAGPLHFCPVCLRKLHHAAGLDPVQQHRSCQKTFARLGLKEEAEWFAQRLKFFAVK